MKKLAWAALVAVAAAVPATANASPVKTGDEITYIVISDRPNGNEISTFDGFNRPVFPTGTLLSTNNTRQYMRRFTYRATATSPYLAIRITSSGNYAGCSALINGVVYSRDNQRGYQASATCN